jgi:hypothetical protein
MKLTRNLLATALSIPLVLVTFLCFSTPIVKAQDSKIAIQRGYRTGYSDGYMAGYRDIIENSSRSVDRHKEYGKADRAYAKEYGALEEYRDGYQQGFENGYITGFDKRSFNAALPTDLKRRGTVSGNILDTQTGKDTSKPPIISPKPDPGNSSQYSGEPIILIPVNTELIVELIGDINTDKSKAGDKFQAKIISPSEINGAIVEGRITKVSKPGRIKRRAEIQLAFDKIQLTDTRWSNFSAILTEVLPIKGDNVKKVDVEGTVEGQSSLKGDIVKVGASTGTGLVIGAIAGGPVGAAVGAGVGAAFGVGAVVVERGKHVNLTKGQQLRIRSAYETQIR